MQVLKTILWALLLVVLVWVSEPSPVWGRGGGGADLA